jgi:hypothetical protein
VAQRRKTEILLEMEETLLIKKSSCTLPVWCPLCQEEFKMVTVDEAAILCGVTSRSIYQAVEGQEIHFIETKEGLLLICPISLQMWRT